MCVNYNPQSIDGAPSGGPALGPLFDSNFANMLAVVAAAGLIQSRIRDIHDNNHTQRQRLARAAMFRRRKPVTRHLSTLALCAAAGALFAASAHADTSDKKIAF